MKKLFVLAAAVVSILPLAFGNAAGAVEGVCPSGYTGPNSENVCVSVTTYECTVVNNNTITIDNENGQLALSGTSTTEDNTTGGSTTTGSATNSNGTNFSVVITNPAPEDEEGSQTCVATATVAPTVPPTTPASVVPAPVTTKVAPKVLPNTSSDQTVGIVVAVLTGLAALAASVRLAAFIYARNKG